MTMRKLLISLAFLFIATPAFAACGAGSGSCFWIGGAGGGNWSNTALWSATSGGAACTCVPASTDSVTFDANSGAGTSTDDVASKTVGVINSSASTAPITITAGNNLTATSWTDLGSTAHTNTVGTGSTVTFTALTGTALQWSGASLTISVSGATFKLLATATGTRLITSNKTFTGAAIVIDNSSNANAFPIRFSSNHTWDSITSKNVQQLDFEGLVTVTTTVSISGNSSSVPLLLMGGNGSGLSIPNAVSADYVSLGGSAFAVSGAGSLSLTNCTNYGVTSTITGGITCSAPSTGSGKYWGG